MKNRKWMRWLYLLLVMVFLAGLALMLYPSVNGLFTDRELAQSAGVFLTQIESIPQETNPEATTPSLPATALPQQHTALWTAMRAYNHAIYVQGQVGLSTEADYQEPSFLLKGYGLESEVFGVISIPAMDLEMPIYLGATKQHMADGAAHLSQTSLPIGGENTNAVIAGHRGYLGASFFRYIEKLQPGDAVTITNLWETLHYEVVDIQIVDPYEVEAIMIQEGRDLVTLLTCHPYASGGKQRYLVYCERVTDTQGRENHGPSVG